MQKARSRKRMVRRPLLLRRSSSRSSSLQKSAFLCHARKGAFFRDERRCAKSSALSGIVATLPDGESGRRFDCFCSECLNGVKPIAQKGAQFIGRKQLGVLRGRGEQME